MHPAREELEGRLACAYADFLLARPEVRGPAIGTTGYCLGRRMSLIAADSGVDHTIEFYPARHGFAVPDNPTYDAGAEARHWEALRELYTAHLQDS